MQALDPKRKRPKEMAAAGLLGEFSILFQEMAAKEQLPERWSSGLPLSANLQFYHPAGQQRGFYSKIYQSIQAPIAAGLPCWSSVLLGES